MRCLDRLSAVTEAESCVTLDDDPFMDRMVVDILPWGRPRVAATSRPKPSLTKKRRATVRECEECERRPPLFLSRPTVTLPTLIEAKPIRPPSDGLAFPFSATVHLADPWAIPESPAALADMVRSLRERTWLQRRVAMRLLPMERCDLEDVYTAAVKTNEGCAQLILAEP
jgi:hypothetical protein